MLVASGLSEQAAEMAMYSAHRTGRGVIGYFEDADDATALVEKIAQLGKAQLPSALIVTSEPCRFHTS